MNADYGIVFLFLWAIAGAVWYLVVLPMRQRRKKNNDSKKEDKDVGTR